jgi:hypothetical protein
MIEILMSGDSYAAEIDPSTTNTEETLKRMNLHDLLILTQLKDITAPYD